MRITKDKASLVADRMTIKHNDVINEKKRLLNEYVGNLAVSKIPEAVKQMFKEYPEWVRSESTIRLKHYLLNNYNYRNHYINVEIPCNDECCYVISDKEAEKVVKMVDEIESLRKERKQLKEEIEITVYNIRTYKRCETDFPEAFKWLPLEKPTTEISIKIDDIRKKLIK